MKFAQAESRRRTGSISLLVSHLIFFLALAHNPFSGS
jgi:hypothetical protein